MHAETAGITGAAIHPTIIFLRERTRTLLRVIITAGMMILTEPTSITAIIPAVTTIIMTITMAEAAGAAAMTAATAVTEARTAAASEAGIPVAAEIRAAAVAETDTYSTNNPADCVIPQPAGFTFTNDSNG